MPILSTGSTPLVVADDLAEFPGAPFSDTVATSAGESIRSEVGWHIAPELTETLTVDSDGGRYLFLPTLRLVDVTEVRDVTSDTPRVLDGWRQSEKGILYRVGGWPVGMSALKVDLTHGYPTCPPALLPAVAAYAQAIKRGGRVTQESLGSRSVSFATSGDGSSLLSVVARYALRGEP